MTTFHFFIFSQFSHKSRIDIKQKKKKNTKLQLDPSLQVSIYLSNTYNKLEGNTFWLMITAVAAQTPPTQMELLQDKHLCFA